MTDTSDRRINVIAVYCDGRPNERHARRPVARLVRTVVIDGSESWTVAREMGRKHSGDDRDNVRFDLQCSHRGCRVSAQVTVNATRDTTALQRLAESLNQAADRGVREVPLLLVAQCVSRQQT
mgnify:CR=1 FL=1